MKRALLGPSVFLVGTHADKYVALTSCMAQLFRLIDVIIRVPKAEASAMLDRFLGQYKSYGVKGAFPVSCPDKQGIKELAQGLHSR